MYAKTTWVNLGLPEVSSSNLNNLESQYSQAIVIGEIQMWGATSSPADFLMCNGTSYLCATYNSLWVVTSNSFGGNGTWFNVPNLMGQYTAGFSGAGDYSTMGKTGGSSEVALTIASMPSHLHSIDAHPNGSYTGLLGFHLSNNTTQTTYTGSGVAHENRPQSVTMNYIIRYQ